MPQFPSPELRGTYVCATMQEHILISFYLFRSRELQVIYFQRRDQWDCLKTIFVGWWFVVLVVQITPQLHHPCTRLSRPETRGDEQCHRGTGKGTIPALPCSLWVQVSVPGFQGMSLHFTKAFALHRHSTKHPLNPTNIL